MAQIRKTPHFGLRRTSILLLLLALLSACSPDTPALSDSTEIFPGEQPTEEPLQSGVDPLNEPQSTALPEVTQEALGRLTVWMPDMLAPLGDETVTDFWTTQFAAFGDENAVTVELRRKRVGDAGGIVATLRSASTVAPGALPDLTLLHRDDLVTAARAGLIQPLDGRFAPAVLDDLYNPVLALGMVDGMLYGLPYAVTVEHLVLSGGTFPAAALTFDALLAQGLPFLFPAEQNSGLSSLFLSQYYAAGGAPLSANSTTVNAEALRTVLRFYERAVSAGLVDQAVLDYASPVDYRFLLVETTSAVAVVTSSTYLDLTQEGYTLDYAALPTPDGQPITTVNGWMWVLTSTSEARQSSALRLVDWLFDARRQSTFTSLLDFLPSQQTAFRFLSNQDYATFASDLLSSAHLPLSDSAGGVVARALQSAFTAVIRQERTADEAVQDVLSQLPE